jgi:hypothetical protein
VRDEISEVSDRPRELANVDAPVFPGDGWDHNMQSRAIRKRRVDEWLRDVNPATTVAQHSFDESAKVVHLLLSRERDGRLSGDRHSLNLLGTGLLDGLSLGGESESGAGALVVALNTTGTTSSNSGYKSASIDTAELIQQLTDDAENGNIPGQYS